MSRSSQSRLKSPLLWANLLLTLLFLLYLCLPLLTPVLLGRAVGAAGGQLTSCITRYSGILRLFSKSCELSLPFGEGTARLVIDDFELASRTFSTFPALNAGSLTIELPEALSSKSKLGKQRSVPRLALPVSEINVSRGTLRIGSKTELDFSGKLILIRQNNDLRLDARLELERLVIGGEKETPFLEVNEGEMILRAALKWAGPVLTPDSAAVLHLKRASGRIAAVSLTDLTGSVSLSHFPDPSSEAATVVHIGTVNFGPELKDVGFKFSVNKLAAGASKLIFEQPQAKIFGGTIAADRIVLAGARPEPFVLKVDTVDLSLLLALATESVHGTGRLSGELPMEFSPTGVSVKSGVIRALAPGGEIRYTPKDTGNAEALQSPNLDLALKALQHFSYETLTAEIDYEEDGLLRANISIFGRNPELLNGRPVQFNITVEQNLLSLLKSLHLATEAGGHVWQ